MFVPKSDSTPRRIPTRIATQLAVLGIVAGYVAVACAPPVTDAQINARATEVVGQYPEATQVEPAIPASGVNMATGTTAPEVRPPASEAPSPAPTETVDTPESIYLQTLSNWDRTSLSMSDGVREGMDPDTRLQNMRHYVELNRALWGHDASVNPVYNNSADFANFDSGGRVVEPTTVTAVAIPTGSEGIDPATAIYIVATDDATYPTGTMILWMPDYAPAVESRDLEVTRTPQQDVLEQLFIIRPLQVGNQFGFGGGVFAREIDGAGNVARTLITNPSGGVSEVTIVSDVGDPNRNITRQIDAKSGEARYFEGDRPIITGETRTTETGDVEIFTGSEWATSPIAKEYFDPTRLTFVDGVVQYRSPGLTVDWSSEANAWVYPERLPYRPGEVVPLSLMGGRLEINNPSEAIRVSNEIVLAWLNNAVNTDYRMAVYGKDSSLTIEDLTTVDPQTGESRHKVKLVNQSGEMQWPNMLVVDGGGEVYSNNLKDTFKGDHGITELDFTSPVWVVEGVEGYESRVGDYLRNQLTGSKTVVSAFTNAGFRFTLDGRFVFVNCTTQIINTTNGHDHSPSYLGGKDGDVIDPDLARAYFASPIAAYRGTVLNCV